MTNSSSTNVRRWIAILLCCALCLMLPGCNQAPKETPPEPQTKTTEKPPQEPEVAPATPPTPPMPPIIETFDDQPQLSLFPRIGGSRPADDDMEQRGYWRTFVEHLQRTSGVVQNSAMDGSNSWTFRGNDGIISLGFFSPLAVQPASAYRISFDFKGDLPEKGEAGIGILEFREFLWISDQFTDEQLRDNLLRSQQGGRLTGKQEWANHSFDFTTTPETGMIHLIMFREGEQSREQIFFDNIRIEPVPPEQPTEK